MPQLPAVQRKSRRAVAPRPSLRPIRVQSALSERSCETTAASRSAALNSCRELIHEKSRPHDSPVFPLSYRLRGRLSLPDLPLRARSHRHTRRHPHLCRGRSSADVRSLRSYCPRRSPAKAPAHLGAVDHPRRYPSRRSRAYDEVRLPYAVGVLENPCQTNSSNSSPNPSALWTRASPTSRPTLQFLWAKERPPSCSR